MQWCALYNTLREVNRMWDQFNILKSIRWYALPMHVHDMGSLMQKMSLMAWVRVILEEGWARVAMLLSVCVAIHSVWDRLSKNIIYLLAQWHDDQGVCALIVKGTEIGIKTIEEIEGLSIGPPSHEWQILWPTTYWSLYIPNNDVNRVKVWNVGVIPKEAWVWPCTPILLLVATPILHLVWHRFRPLGTFLRDCSPYKE